MCCKFFSFFFLFFFSCSFRILFLEVVILVRKVRTYVGSIWKESDGIEWDGEGAVMMMMMMIRVKGGYRE